MRSAIFDLDGTLADTSGDLIAAANACFPTPVLSRDTDKSLAFQGGRAMLREGFARRGEPWSEADVERWFPVLLDAYGANIDRHTVIYDGVEAALDALAGRGWALGVCTNKPHALAEVLLDRLGLRTRFAALLGADSLPVRKPDAQHLLETIARVGGSPTRSVLIGDTMTDRMAAKNAKVPCVLVTFGPDGRAVADHGPEELLDNYAGLPPLLERMIPA